jgi:hypothetical protein
VRPALPDSRDDVWLLSGSPRHFGRIDERLVLSKTPTSFVTLQSSATASRSNVRKREIEDGAIVAVWTALGERMTREELVAVAMQTWEQSVIEAALGKDAPSVLPEATRLVELRARVPRYQRDVLRALARREGTSVDAVLTRELEDVACAYRDELVGVVPELAVALAWPEGAGAGATRRLEN